MPTHRLSPYLRPRGQGRATFPTTCEGSNQHSSTTHQNLLQATYRHPASGCRGGASREFLSAGVLALRCADARRTSQPYWVGCWPPRSNRWAEGSSTSPCSLRPTGGSYLRLPPTPEPLRTVIGAGCRLIAMANGLSAPVPRLVRNRTLDVALFVRVQRGNLRCFYRLQCCSWYMPEQLQGRLLLY